MPEPIIHGLRPPTDSAISFHAHTKAPNSKRLFALLNNSALPVADEANIDRCRKIDNRQKQATFKSGDELMCVKVPRGSEGCIKIGHFYKAHNYSYWIGDTEMVMLKKDDGGEQYKSYPVACFYKENQ